MAKSFVFSALLVASLLVATPVNVNGDISDIVKAAGMIVEFLSGGDCPNFSGSDQCKCRSFMLIINSGDRANSTAHKGPTLVYDRSSYKWGSQCQVYLGLCADSTA